MGSPNPSLAHLQVIPPDTVCPNPAPLISSLQQANATLQANGPFPPHGNLFGFGSPPPPFLFKVFFLLAILSTITNVQAIRGMTHLLQAEDGENLQVQLGIAALNSGQRNFLQPI